MVAVTATYYSGYSTTTSSQTGTTTASASSTTSAKKSTSSASTSATSITLSDAAKAALSEKSLASVITDARAKLTKLLEDAGRKSPLQNGELALDLSTLDSREIYAIASDKSFSADESEAATLEMQRRFEAALSGPHSIAQVTGNYTGLYNAAAAFLDALGPEEKASADWKASRDAVTEGLKQLQTDPKKLPSAGEDDPVATYIKLVETRGTLDQSMATLATNARTALDKRYEEIHATGRIPSFKPTSQSYVDLSALFEPLALGHRARRRRPVHLAGSGRREIPASHQVELGSDGRPQIGLSVHRPHRLQPERDFGLLVPQRRRTPGRRLVRPALRSRRRQLFDVQQTARNVQPAQRRQQLRQFRLQLQFREPAGLIVPTGNAANGGASHPLCHPRESGDFCFQQWNRF
ncbi:hypothetical protein [Devosia riboflavina]